jgi:chromosome segregation ATPase
MHGRAHRLVLLLILEGRRRFFRFSVHFTMFSFVIVLNRTLLVTRLQDEASRYMKKIEVERSKIAELDEQIVKYQEQILEQKTRLGGVNAAQVNNKLIQKQIKVLDNRLDKCLLKYNETIAQNKVLRQKIDEYRRERIVFDVIYKKIERDLHEKKKEMTAIINDSKNAYQARDKSQSEMRNLQSQAEKERSDFEAEFKDLGDMIKQQQIMLEQLRLKQFERTNEDNVVAASVNEERSGEMTNAMSNWGGGNKDKNLAPLSQEKIHSYEETLLKIQVRSVALPCLRSECERVFEEARFLCWLSASAVHYGRLLTIVPIFPLHYTPDPILSRAQESTGIYDINEIVNKFMEAEEQNFSLFNYVNDVNSEIERLEHSISGMRNQIEKYKGQDASSNTQRKKTVRDLEDRLTKTDKKAEDYESRYNLAVRTINQLKNGIQSIFTRIGATSASVDEMLGNQVRLVPCACAVLYYVCTCAFPLGGTAPLILSLALSMLLAPVFVQFPDIFLV